MNRTAIDDLLSGILSSWFESVADWTPPGRSSAETCVSCSRSLLSDAVDVRVWPHDLVHQLASSLESAARDIRDSFDDEVAARYGLECVRLYITEAVRARGHDIVDVLVECVEPRVAAYVAREVARELARAGR